MAQYGAINIGALLTASGVSVAGTADIEVRRESDGALASIYSDEAGTTPIAQPGFQTDASGRAKFYTPGTNHGLKITITKGAESHIWRNVPVGTAGQRDATDFGASLMAAADKPSARSLLGIGTGDGFGPSVTLLNGKIVQSRAVNAETIAIKTFAGTDPSATDPVYVVFRDQAATTGGYVLRTITAAMSLVISSGSTMGAVNGVPFRLWYVLFDDGGVLRLGAINCVSSAAGPGAGRDISTIYPLAAWGVASSTAEGGAGAADSAQTFYSGVAVASKPYSVVGYATWEAGLAAAGTWGTAPSRIQLFGSGVPLPGRPVQVARSDTGALATGTTVLPDDDTIPQNTEGVQVLSQAITPTSAANALCVTASVNAAHSANAAVTSALFQDTTANALAALKGQSAGAGNMGQAVIRRQILAGTTSATTFKVRSGGSGAGTVTFNGEASARKFGGVANSFLEVEEVMG